MQFIDIAHALATAGIYAGLATVGLLFVSHLASYRPNASATSIPKPEPTPKPEPEPVAEPATIVEPEVIEPESDRDQRVQELYDLYRGMTLRALRKEVKGRVRGIRNLTLDVLARRLAEAVAATA